MLVKLCTLTMKLIFFLIITSSVYVYGQTWHLENIDTSQKYSYQYWIHIDSANTKNEYDLKLNTGDQNSTIFISDFRGDTLLFHNLRIIKLTDDFDTIINSNSHIVKDLKLSKGTYRVEIYSVDYDDFKVEFDLEDDQYFTLNVSLNLVSYMKEYQIESISELQESEIMQIIDCVRNNPHEYFFVCPKEDSYYITVQI